ncbi:helix-turn-helix transcriptional regulator [Leptolyngbya sp. FACHB-36]|uniref:helix-turn-helix domain-containing protein n=1 Tax=Leptolyngbya sp. FACHB-36 TaxID=2692808 RepID=UPI0016813A1F|nr:helix-turn-helix transcriptional regulator [Leptolyngbya sp. FACHB-36]MBD2019235.1 helix-turn-helix transcriptional regulator [Leptolyngbya sp. FACHB-36]
MKFSEAFRETVFRFKLSGAEIAERSGLTTAQISQFRNGKNLRIDSVEKILNALTLEQRQYLLMLVARDDNGNVPLPPTEEP